MNALRPPILVFASSQCHGVVPTIRLRKEEVVKRETAVAVLTSQVVYEVGLYGLTQQHKVSTYLQVLRDRSGLRYSQLLPMLFSGHHAFFQPSWDHVVVVILENSAD